MLKAFGRLTASTFAQDAFPGSRYAFNTEEEAASTGKKQAFALSQLREPFRRKGCGADFRPAGAARIEHNPPQVGREVGVGMAGLTEAGVGLMGLRPIGADREVAARVQ